MFQYFVNHTSIEPLFHVRLEDNRGTDFNQIIYHYPRGNLFGKYMCVLRQFVGAVTMLKSGQVFKEVVLIDFYCQLKLSSVH